MKILGVYLVLLTVLLAAQAHNPGWKLRFADHDVITSEDTSMYIPVDMWDKCNAKLEEDKEKMLAELIKLKLENGNLKKDLEILKKEMEVKLPQNDDGFKSRKEDDLKSLVSSMQQNIIQACKLDKIEFANTLKEMNAVLQEQIGSMKQEIKSVQLGITSVNKTFPDAENKLEHQISAPMCNQTYNGLFLQKLATGYYYFSNDSALMNWSESRDFCLRHKLQLLSVESSEELVTLDTYIRKTYVHPDPWWFWTSGSDMVKEGHWIWTSNNKTILLDVYRDQNKFEHQDCLRTFRRGGLLCIGDYLCSFKHRYICEFKCNCQ